MWSYHVLKMLKSYLKESKSSHLKDLIIDIMIQSSPQTSCYLCINDLDLGLRAGEVRSTSVKSNIRWSVAFTKLIGWDTKWTAQQGDPWWSNQFTRWSLWLWLEDSYIYIYIIYILYNIYCILCVSNCGPEASRKSDSIQNRCTESCHSSWPAQRHVVCETRDSGSKIEAPASTIILKQQKEQIDRLQTSSTKIQFLIWTTYFPEIEL